jgi:dCMP deaminase
VNSLKRKSWDEYFFDVARTVASRSTCPRLRVGAVLVRGSRIVGTGYNGSLPAMAHCSESGCLIDGTHCIRTVHAEANLVAGGAIRPLDRIYVTHRPCFTCYKLLRTAGITDGDIKWEQDYGKAYPLL